MNETSRNGARSFLWTMGIAWAALLAISLAPHSPYFRPWELLQSGPVGFLPTTELEMASCGDLGRNAWIPELKEWHSVKFTTDEAGLRNAPGAPWPRIVVVGDSFVVGSGVGDSQTIPAQIRDLLGEPVYNYGTVAGVGPIAFLCDPRSSASPPEVVFWAPASRVVEPIFLGAEMAPAPTDSSVKATIARLAGEWRAIGDRWLGWKGRIDERSAIVPFTKTIFHGAWWRASGTPWEIQTIDVGGRTRLVLALEALRLCAPAVERRLDATVESIARFAAALRSRGSRLVFAPIPDTGTIYADRYPAPQQARLQTPPFLDLVFEELSRRGIACVDLRPAFREAREPYLFLSDDSHLNSRGARVAARVMVDALGGILARGPAGSRPVK